MMEEWRDVVGYEGLYQVSNLGRVRSLDFDTQDGRSHKGRYIKQHNNGHGYLTITLWKDGSYVRRYVHRIVATAFCENKYNQPQVNHIDEDKSNNMASNLEWVSRLYNCRYSRLQEKLTMRKMKPVLQIDENGNTIAEFESINFAARSTGADPRYICRTCKGVMKSAGGFFWKYK